MLGTLNEIDDSTGARFPATTMNSPLASSSITTLQSGVLENWLVEPGQSVNRGEVLAQIRSQDLLDLQNDWLNSQQTLQQQNFELDKDRGLLSEGIISMQRFMQTERSYKQAESSARLLEEKLALSGFDESQRQALLNDNQNLGLYSLRSPGNGTISHLAVMAGAYVETNTRIASLSSPELWLSAQLPARLAYTLEPGQTLRAEGINIPLTLRQKDFEIDANTQTLELYASFDAMPNLLPGQIVTLLIPQTSQGILIPANAVVHSGNETNVYIRTSTGFEVRALNLQPAGADYLALDGVQSGEQVVIRGAAILKGIQSGLGGE